MPESPVTRFAYPNAFPRPLAGRVEQHTITSELLAKNPLGDPAERPLEVYVPRPSTAPNTAPRRVVKALIWPS